MNPSSEDRRLGEYHLKEVLAESPSVRTWLATQSSVARLVVVEELLDPAHRAAFLADARAKAGVDHPIVSSLYEAVDEPGVCFYAHELLPGDTLQQSEEPLLPARITHLLRRVAEANLQHEALGHSTSPLDLDAIHVDRHGVVRLKNLAISGMRTQEQSARDIVQLGTALVPRVADGKPAATRLLTLLAWMRGEGLEEPIHWGQVRDFCEQIEQQLAEATAPAPSTRRAERKKSGVRTVVIAGATVAVLAAIGTVAIAMRPPKAAAAPRRPLPPPVAVRAGNHPTPDGLEEGLPAFRIAAHEVTIAQYAEFLEILALLAKDQREQTYDHEAQPKEKSSHVPDDWNALYAAAKANAEWRGRRVDLDSPVVGVDWWDAAAYVDWKKARLPTQEEWFAALRQGVTAPAAIVPAGWGTVTAETPDRTPSGLIGMAGSVCEWTSRPAANPANPLGERLWVIVGGSYLKSGSNALTREWTADRSLRRPDLGFRVAFDAE